MTLQSNGTPALVSTTVGAGSNAPSVTGTFPTGASPLAGHLIAVVISLYGSTAVTSVTPPAGYTVGPTITATNCLCRLYTKTATGSDSAPTFTGVTTGTAADGCMTITIYDISDPVNGNTPVIDASGSGAGTTTLTAVTTSTTLASAGELAICMATIGQGTVASSPNTWTTPTNWTLASASCAQTAAAFSQTANYFTTNATVLTSGSTATVTMAKTRTTTRTAKLIVTFAPVQTFGPALAPLSQPAGIRTQLWRTGVATASLIPVVVAAPPVTPATPIPLHAPVHAPFRRPPPRGRVYSNPGVREQTGPAAIPLHQPVRARVLVRFSKGRAYGISAGVRNQTGPPVPPLHSPVAQGNANVPARNGAGLGRRGVVHRRAGLFQGTGPAAIPLHQPVTARVRILPGRGRTYSRAGVFEGLGPAVTPLHKPVTPVVRVLPSRGRAYWRYGVFVPAAAPAPVLHQPVTSRVRVLPGRGHTASSAGVREQTGPQLYPLAKPVTGRLNPPRKGRFYSSPATTPVVVVTPATFYPFRQPVRARPGARLNGRAATMALLPFTVVPNTTVAAPLTSPVRARVLPLRKGRAYGSQGAPNTPLLAITPPVLHTPVKAKVPPPLRGRAYSRNGIFEPAAAAFPALRQPVKARPPLPTRGRTYGNKGAPVFIPQAAAIRPLGHPVRGRAAPQLVGRAATMGVLQIPAPAPSTPAVVYPLTRPVHAPFPRARKGGYGQGRFSVVVGIGVPLLPLSTPPGGRVYYQRTGFGQGTVAGPATPAVNRTVAYPIHAPVKARPPLPIRGRALSTPPYVAPFINTTRPIPLHAPVRARPPLPPRGRSYKNVRVNPVLNSTILFPLHQPVRARPPLPRRGHAASTPPYVPPFVPPGGHGYPYTARLLPARWSAFLIDGEWAASQKVPVRYYAVAVDARWPSSPIAGRWFATNGPA